MACWKRVTCFRDRNEKTHEPSFNEICSNFYYWLSILRWGELSDWIKNHLSEKTTQPGLSFSYPKFSVRVAYWNNYFWQIYHQGRTVSDWIQIILDVSSLFFDIFRRGKFFVFFQKFRERRKIIACFSKIIAQCFKKFWEFSSIRFFRYDFSRFVEPLPGAKNKYI